MSLVAQLAAGLAAFMHVIFFCVESLWFTRPRIYRRFLLTSSQDAELVRPMAFNQGFYNLFLAGGAAGGVVAVHAGSVTVGRTLILFACGCMVAAGIVLIATDRRFLRAALLQAVPPLAAFAATLL